MTDQQKIKQLKKALRMVIDFIPNGFPMPLGFDHIVHQAENIYNQVK